MKKLNTINIVFIAAFLLLLIVGIFRSGGIETNVLKTVLMGSKEDSLLINISDKHLSKIKIIFEGDNKETVELTRGEFLKRVDFKYVKETRIVPKSLLNAYNDTPYNLLAKNAQKTLEAKNYSDFKEKSLKNSYNPLDTFFVAYEKDPFMLFDDFISELNNDYQKTFTYGGKIYKILTIELKNDAVSTPLLLNEEVEKIINIQNGISTINTSVYLTGAPIHSYYASAKSLNEINYICIGTIVCLSILTLVYFRSVKILLAILLSIVFGGLCGYFATSIIFQKVHILTFAFSLIIIGTGIDYCMQYFTQKDLTKILKNLTISMLLSVSIFLMLLLSNIELLRQIAVFSSVGVFNIYVLVVFFFPLFFPNETTQTKEFKSDSFKLDFKWKTMLLLLATIVVIFGLCQRSYDQSIKSTYIPLDKLAYAEKLLDNIEGNDEKTTYALVESTDFENLMQKEEGTIAQISAKYDSLSKFVPSSAKQKQNRELIYELYQTKLDKNAKFLKQEQKDKLLKDVEESEPILFEKNKYPELNVFLIDKNTSLVTFYNQKNYPKIQGVEYINPTKSISKKIVDTRHTCLKLLIPIFICLYLLLAIFYGIRNATKIILPSFLAILFSLGLLGVTGKAIDIFHILTLFLIIGISLNHSLFRFNSMEKTKNSILISLLSCVFLFFLLSMTAFKSTSSLGLMAFVGLLASYIFSLIFINEG